MRLITITLCFITMCSAAVNQYKFATWNSAGAKWEDVQSLMVDHDLDVLTVQEAGDPPAALGDKRKPGRNADEGTVTAFDPINYETPETIYIERTPGRNDRNFYALELVWNTDKGSFFIYYFDRFTSADREQLRHKGDRDMSTALNIAIITKSRAEKIYFMLPIDKDGNFITDEADLKVNRPVIGVRFGNAIFFSIHPLPTDTSNEAQAIVEKIYNFLINQRVTWAITGDYNREPVSLTIPRNCEIIKTRLATRAPKGNAHGSARELDYGVVCDPKGLMPGYNFAPSLIDNITTSDHNPVRFNV